MSNEDPEVFAQPILNLPYDYPGRHWELDPSGQPTHRIIESRRSAQFISPFPKPGKRRGKTSWVRASISFPPKMDRTLAVLAKQENILLAWLVRNAAEKYVTFDPKERRGA